MSLNLGRIFLHLIDLELHHPAMSAATNAHDRDGEFGLGQLPVLFNEGVQSAVIFK